MDAENKFRLFATQMHLEMDADNEARPPIKAPSVENKVLPCGQIAGSKNAKAKQDALGITEAVMPGGKRIKLLKTLLTSACERNCYYCPFRAGRNFRRATFNPDEMAVAFMDRYRAGLVEGLFLSSGIIKGGIATQDRLIKTGEILRQKHNFQGYLHIKIMPGSEREQVMETMKVASRVSVNLEGPNGKRLRQLTPRKAFMEELLQPLRWVQQIRENDAPHGTWNGRWPSSTTQFVVGAVGESDLELLSTSEYLYKHLRLSRTYYMAFNPVPDTPFEHLPAEDPWRQNRLYQSSFLLRDYDFDLEELPFDRSGNLPRTADPKEAWARQHLAEDPVELNRAEREMLLRVPGIGPKGAGAILNARRHATLKDLADLEKIGIYAKRPAPFVLLNGKRPAYQMALFQGL